MDNEKIFNRVEKKYLLTKSQKQVLLAIINQHMEPDRYFKSDIFNIYFDNDNYDLIIQSNERTLFKEKFRARSYAGYDKVFLEIKTKVLERAYRTKVLTSDDVMKDNSIGYKRRILITHHDYNDFIKGKSSIIELAKKNLETPSDLQISKEIDYLIHHFDLKPKILVSYSRESYLDPHGLRITLDSNLAYRTNHLTFTKSHHDIPYFSDNTTIMEVKTKDSLPLWLVKTLSSEHLYPQTFSKIGKIYEKIISDNR